MGVFAAAHWSGTIRQDEEGCGLLMEADTRRLSRGPPVLPSRAVLQLEPLTQTVEKQGRVVHASCDSHTSRGTYRQRSSHRHRLSGIIDHGSFNLGLKCICVHTPQG